MADAPACCRTRKIAKAADFDSAMRRFESSRPSQAVGLRGVIFPGGENRSPKHKMACMWCNSRPRPALSVTQEGPEPARRAGSLGIFREGLKMATIDKLIQEIGSRYCIGSKAYPLVQETLGLIKRQPGGIGSFVNRFKAAGFAVEVASWLGGPDPVPLSGQEVEQTLGSDVISGIANEIGVSQRFARTILGYAIPKIIVLRAQGGAIPPAISAWAASFRDSAIHSFTPINEITEHRAEQIRPSRTEYGGAAAGLRPLLIPGASLLITLGLLLGYFIGAGDRGAIQSADCGAKCACGVPACAFDTSAAGATQ